MLTRPARTQSPDLSEISIATTISVSRLRTRLRRGSATSDFFWRRYSRGPCVSLNDDNKPRGAWLNVLISREFTFRHGICLRSGNVLLAGIMTLAWIEDDLDHGKRGKNA
jgi:hypothetical protein